MRMRTWMSENVVEDGKDSEAERVEGVGEHQIVI